MDVDMLREIKRKAEVNLAKRNYLGYLKYVNRYDREFTVGKHIEYLADRLNKLENEKGVRLVVSLPPQHGKSMTITETYPSYYLSKYPDKRVMVATYGDLLADKFGSRNRSKVEDVGDELFGVKLDKSNASKKNWGLEGERGGFISTTIRGGATGHSADLLIVDDPFKNREEAESKLLRDKVYEEYKDSFLSRLSAEGNVIIIMTRWHEDDLVGRVLGEGDSGRWEIINIPCLAEEDDLLGREVGEALFGEIGKNESWASKVRLEVGERGWNALFQGRPRPLEGTVVKSGWLEFYEVLPDVIEEYVISADTAGTDNKTSDYSVIQFWGRVGVNHYLIDMIEGKWIYPTLKDKFINFCELYPEALKKLIENKSSGISLIGDLRVSMEGIVEVNPKGDKLLRLERVSTLIKTGNVYIPARSSFTERFEEQLLSFPYGTDDDIVDATSQYLNDYIEESSKRKNVRRRRSVKPVRIV